MSMRSRKEQDLMAAGFEFGTTATGVCASKGPWGAVCTEDFWHDYSHYDATLDTSWTDHYEDWPDNLASHPSDCECKGGHAWDKR